MAGWRRRLHLVPGGMKAAAPALIASPGLCSRRWGDLRGRVEVFIYTIADAIVLVEPRGGR
jgi:hypothetical protein